MTLIEATSPVITSESSLVNVAADSRFTSYFRRIGLEVKACLMRHASDHRTVITRQLALPAGWSVTPTDCSGVQLVLDEYQAPAVQIAYEEASGLFHLTPVRERFRLRLDLQLAHEFYMVTVYVIADGVIVYSTEPEFFMDEWSRMRLYLAALDEADAWLAKHTVSLW